MKIVTLFEALGLGAALFCALAIVRGAWGEAFGCLMVVTVCSFLAALWETEK